MKMPLLFVIFTLWLTVAWSQNVTNKKEVINATVTNSINNASTDLPFFTSTNDAEEIVTRIMETVGLEGNFKIKVANVPNVEANIRHHQRYILYNPEFVGQLNKASNNRWASIFILAHEIGHHLNGHTLIGSNGRPELELEADQFAGFILCKMGATLEQAQLAMQFIANIQASKTHPGRTDRLLAIQRGWDKADAQIKGITYISKSTSETTAPN